MYTLEISIKDAVFDNTDDNAKHYCSNCGSLLARVLLKGRNLKKYLNEVCYCEHCDILIDNVVKS